MKEIYHGAAFRAAVLRSEGARNRENLQGTGTCEAAGWQIAAWLGRLPVAVTENNPVRNYPDFGPNP